MSTKVLKITVQEKEKMFDDMSADLISNKKLYPIATGLIIRGQKLNIPLLFIAQSYFIVPKDVRLNTKHFFIMKILNKKELQQLVFNHSSDNDSKDFLELYRKFTAKNIHFLR